LFPFQFLFTALVLFSASVVAGDPGIALEGAWVRALPPTQPNTAAYLSISNKGPEPVIITSASSELAGRVEFHTTREVDGYVRMEKLSTLEVAPGEQLNLSPGGTHLMLLDLERMPSAGETLSLCLVYSPTGKVCTEAAVRKGSGQAAHQHHH